MTTILVDEEGIIVRPDNVDRFSNDDIIVRGTKEKSECLLYKKNKNILRYS